MSAARYRHKLTGAIVRVVSRSNNRIIVMDVETGTRMYYDALDFTVQYREVGRRQA